MGCESNVLLDLLICRGVLYSFETLFTFQPDRGGDAFAYRKSPRSFVGLICFELFEICVK